MDNELTPKLARFFARSAARLERLLIINAPLTFVENELKTARNRLTELEEALGVGLGRAPADPQRNEGGN